MTSKQRADQHKSQNQDGQHSDGWAMVSSERRRLAADLRGLRDSDLGVMSDLPGWTAKHVLAHTVMPFLVPTPSFILRMIRFRGDLDQVNNFFASRLIERPFPELLEALGNNADSHWTPPGHGVDLPLTEIAVHGQDIRRALGIGSVIPAEVTARVLRGQATNKTATETQRADIASRLSPVPDPLQS